MHTVANPKYLDFELRGISVVSVFTTEDLGLRAIGQLYCVYYTTVVGSVIGGR